MADQAALAAAADRWCRAFLACRGLDTSLVEQSGVTVVSVAERLDTGIASAYIVGRHTVVFADERVRPMLESFDVDVADIDAFTSFAETAGAEILGTGVQRTLVGSDPVADSGSDMVRLDRESADDVARLTTMLDACTEDEIDEAAIELDELDPVIFCVEAAPGGELIAYASAFPDDDFAGEWDIGVLTHPDHRRKGLGRRCVEHLCAHLLADGEVPLYRHDIVNAGSAALAESLGFEPVSWVTAIKFTAGE